MRFGRTTIERYTQFIALPDSEKERIVKRIEGETLKQSLTRSRPLNPRERREWRRFKKMGRPKIGKGARTISLTVENDLLKPDNGLHCSQRSFLFYESG
jgi:hypothetical protein